MKKSILVLFFLLPFFCFSQESQKETLVNIADFVEKDAITFYWDSLSGMGTLEKNGHSLSFSLNSEFIILDGQKLGITHSPLLKNGMVYISEDFMAQARNLFTTVIEEPSHFKIDAIYIDAGHGGKDPGTIDTHTINGKKVTLKEKDITLKVAKNLHATLKKAYPSKKIELTRKDDTFLSLEQRVEIANSVKLAQNEAILFVSIHVNAAFDKKATGFEVWYLSPGYRRNLISNTDSVDKEILPILNSMLEEEFTQESILMAKSILDAMDKEVGSQSKNRGLKEEEWFVVRNANMPSVLIELGFITNKQEATLLHDDKYLHKLSRGIYNGLETFITNFEHSRGFTTGQ